MLKPSKENEFRIFTSMKISIYLLVILSLCCCFSCNLDTVEPDTSRMGYDFFPYDEDAYRIYHVVSEHQALDTIIAEDYYLKEVIGEEITSFTEYTIRLYRYKKETLSEEWELDSVWAISPTATRVVVIENDVSFTKLIFPLKFSSTWDGNAFNDHEEEMYFIDDFYEPKTFDELSFDTTLTVVHSETNTNNLINVDSRYEIYAKGVGLIYRYEEISETQPGESTLGRTYEQTLIEYGN